MKTTIKALTLTFILALFLVPCSYAFPVTVGQQITFSHGLGGGTNGGEFIVSDLGGQELFRTFCLERDEWLNYSDSFIVTDISEYASNGGVGGAIGDKDFLSDSTKWLYWHYANGTLDDAVAGFNYTDIGADAMQRTVWALENEIPYFAGSSYDYLYLAAKNYANSLFSDFGNVQVMNIINARTGELAQSQLISEPVPEPATMLLLGTGLVGLAGVTRRRKKK